MGTETASGLVDSNISSLSVSADPELFLGSPTNIKKHIMTSFWSSFMEFNPVLIFSN